jgi:flagellar protein FlgJ
MKITAPIPAPPANEPLRRAADQLEVRFLAEMLKSAGLGQVSSTFGGGMGEEQFTSFLLEEYAGSIVAAGGIGLSELVFNAMKGPLND